MQEQHEQEMKQLADKYERMLQEKERA